MSVDAEPILERQGLDWHFSLQGYDDYFLVRFQAASAREKQLAVAHVPINGNEAHTLAGC